MLSKQDLELLIRCVDSAIKANGLNGVVELVNVAQKLIQMVNEPEEPKKSINEST